MRLAIIDLEIAQNQSKTWATQQQSEHKHLPQKQVDDNTRSILKNLNTLESKVNSVFSNIERTYSPQR